MKHSVPVPIKRAGCLSLAACVHCDLFGVKDGAEGCGGENIKKETAARVEQYLRNSLRGPVFILFIGTVDSVDRDGTMRISGPVFLDPKACSHVHPITRSGQCLGCGAVVV